MTHPVLRNLSHAAAGLLFAAGLGLAGMTQPTKVVGFLDVLGDWDPSLAFVMVGGILTHMALYRFIVRRPSPLMADAFRIPTRRDITPRLVVGSAMFGAGWAIAGFCPGPSLVSAGAGAPTGLLFLGAMLGGMALFQLYDRRAPQGTPPAARPGDAASGGTAPAA
ncbi:MAG: DUF6691 family protein [Myxococcota bacterium]|nr:DUF6691 family protein [Myxococcota bacterium]